MFEDINFDINDDEGVLRTSFNPVLSSTQTFSLQKRPSEETDKDNSKKSRSGPTHSRNVVVKRRFPGPAGLLPERTECNKSFMDFIADEEKKIEDTEEMFLCSQSSISVFEDGPWNEMIKDFYVENGECLYEKFNIKWIKRQAALGKLLVSHKAPFLAAIIQGLEIFDGKIPTINITLKDATGDIQGTVLHSLYEEHSNSFTVGSVLVLKQFGVLSAYNNHCLTITPNNLITIYSLDVRISNANKDTESCTQDRTRVNKVVIQKCTVEEIMKKYSEDVSAHEEKQRSLSFNKLHPNFASVRRTGSIEDGYARSCNKFHDNNIKSKTGVGSPKIKNNFNRTVSENTTVSNSPLEAMSKIVSNDDSKKKRFNFKSSNLQKPHNEDNIKSSSSDRSNLLSNAQNISNNNSCDSLLVINSQSQISVKLDNKEHSEIWKNLLEGVDTDSLFDDF